MIIMMCKGAAVEIDDIVLEQLSEEADVSQRKLAKKTNLSLGSLNLVLHRLAHKGLVKIEKINSRNLKYILTPEGIARNTKRTCQYIRFAFQQVVEVKNRFTITSSALIEKGFTLYLLEEDDPISHMMQQAQKENQLHQVKRIKHIEAIEASQKAVVFIWTPEQEAACEQYGVAFINVVKKAMVDKTLGLE